MILATYQPIIDDIAKRKTSQQFSLLQEALGYYPIFCFPATNVEQAIIHSILAAPNCPERLILFESEEYDCLDIIKWNLCLASNSDTIPADLINPAVPDKYKEFCVKNVSNIIVDVPIEQAVQGKILLNFQEDSDSGNADVVRNFYKQMSGLSQQQLKSIQITVSDENGSIVKDNEFGKMRLYKMVFETYLLPLFYQLALGEFPFVNVNPKTWNQMFLRISSMLSNFYNIDAPVVNKTYAYYDCLYEILHCCVCDSRWPQNIGRNDACPCGSGKKYKKCHGLY